jgi:hypothetical protein
MKNYFDKEPEFNCPICNAPLQTDWVDNGFGPFAVQASPYACNVCNWSEKGCTECIYEKCFSWERCRGRALITNGQEETTKKESTHGEYS